MTEGTLYKNLGAPIKRGDTVVAQRGDVFAPTPEERLRLEYKLQLVSVPPRRAERRSGEEAKAAKPKPTPPAAKPADAPTPPVEKASGDVMDYHVGGGWYLLPTGLRVKGKRKAKAKLAEMNGG